MLTQTRVEILFLPQEQCEQDKLMFKHM